MSKSQRELKNLMRIFFFLVQKRDTYGPFCEKIARWRGAERQAVGSNVDLPELSLGDQMAEVWNLFFS